MARVGSTRTRPHGPRRLAPWAALAGLPLLLLWPPLRFLIESHMSLHMLVEFPALLASGWCGRLWSRRHPAGRAMDQVAALLDWRGWTSATLASAVAIAWMIPSLLDAALLAGEVAALKYASWWLAGWLLAGGWRRMDPELLLFFIGNLSWMLATAGLLYIDAPVRLCVNYLQDDQRHAGIGLVLLAGALAGLAIRAATVQRRQEADRRMPTRS